MDAKESEIFYFYLIENFIWGKMNHHFNIIQNFITLILRTFKILLLGNRKDLKQT